ncbi:cell division protein ZapD [Candidatus Parabeggiatoa sp. HSG14]|uniref:cell division protein ZapD n=1 Tax=Candidatus Parabeggiatoa sp. HSG14 TaxID=3055593 RepID=UPI0025A7FECE|nr:cell division protein ZapD [Thiotrichales bacterium HSG14]
MKKKVIYEQPLSDPMKNFLRLEYLFEDIVYHLKGPSEWDSRAVINRYIEINEFLNRFDFKTALIRDLTIHAKHLAQWQRTPEVDSSRLNDLLTQTTIIIDKLGKVDTNGDKYSLQQKLIHLVQKRRAILGGTSRSDLPGFYYWLQKGPKQRQSELSKWLEPYEPLHEALELNLYFIRNNAVVSQEVALGGFFQSKLENTNVAYQMIQVMMPIEHTCYPEINGGKQRFTIRFFEQQTNEQPLQSEIDIKFELGCCITSFE